MVSPLRYRGNDDLNSKALSLENMVWEADDGTFVSYADRFLPDYSTPDAIIERDETMTQIENALASAQSANLTEAATTCLMEAVVAGVIPSMEHALAHYGPNVRITKDMAETFVEGIVKGEIEFSRRPVPGQSLVWTEKLIDDFSPLPDMLAEDIARNSLSVWSLLALPYGDERMPVLDNINQGWALAFQYDRRAVNRDAKDYDPTDEKHINLRQMSAAGWSFLERSARTVQVLTAMKQRLFELGFEQERSSEEIANEAIEIYVRGRENRKNAAIGAGVTAERAAAKAAKEMQKTTEDGFRPF